MSVTIRPVNASLTRDTDTFTRMDPYVVIVGEGQTHRTQVCNEGGKQPSWNDSLVFQGVNQPFFKVQVWDKDNINDDIVGEGQLNLNPGMGGGQNYNVPIFHHGKSAGMLNIFVEVHHSHHGNQGGYGGGFGQPGW